MLGPLTELQGIEAPDAAPVAAQPVIVVAADTEPEANEETLRAKIRTITESPRGIRMGTEPANV